MRNSPLALFFKAHVGAYLRGGKMVNVGGYQGRNKHAVAMPGQRSLFADEPVDAPRQHPTDTPEFKAWFGNSKVVDAAGKPLVVYHGTPNDFTEFTQEKANYFTASNEAAGYYAEGFGIKRDGQVMPVYLTIKNPKVLPLTESAKITKAEMQKYADQGFDGVFGTQSSYMAEGQPAISILPDGRYVTEAIPFNPAQIKSATGNKGGFDPSNPDITKSLKVIFTVSRSGAR